MPISEAIDIRVVTQYIEEQSEPDDEQFVFAYTITITNRGLEAARLLDRYWKITDGNNDITEVRGDGVVGEQPMIESGESYRYTSGTVMKTAVGMMEGHYGMRSVSGEEFKAAIARFSLVSPNALH